MKISNENLIMASIAKMYANSELIKKDIIDWEEIYFVNLSKLKKWYTDSTVKHLEFEAPQTCLNQLQ